MSLMSIHEVCQKTGVTRRTLQHYDDIGLLPPTARTEGGIRQYDEQAVRTLLEILTYREFGFSLEEIKTLLQGPAPDRKAALEEKITALRQERDHLNALIGFAEAVSFYGIVPVQLQEVGDIPYSEFLSKLRGEWNVNLMSEQSGPILEAHPELNDTLIRLYDGLCGMCGSDPGSAEVQAKVGELREFIQENMYKSPIMGFRMLGDTLLSGGDYALGMKQIYGEEATAFAAAAIKRYCDRVEQMQTESRKPGVAWKPLFEAAEKRNREDT